MVTIALYLWLIVFAILGFSMNSTWSTILVVVIGAAGGLWDGLRRSKMGEEKRRKMEEMRRRKLYDDFDEVQ